MSSHTKTFTILSLAVLLSVGLSACHTIGGAGKDIGHAGDAIEDSANSAH